MQSTDELFDLVGLGFGPANVSIAGAIVEAWAVSYFIFISSMMRLLMAPCYLLKVTLFVSIEKGSFLGATHQIPMASWNAVARCSDAD